LSSGTSFEKSVAVLFLLLSLLTCIDLKSLKTDKKIIKFFNIMNYIILTTSFFVIFQNQVVSQLFINFYSDFYNELLPNMLSRGKPVFTFATHSIAGFYMFIFFYLNLKCFHVLQEKKFLIMAFAYLYFCIELQSNTSLFFLIIGLIILFLSIQKKIKTIASLLLPIILGWLLFKEQIYQYWLTFQADYYRITQSLDNGLIGRFVGGNQSSNIEIILSNPFIGFGFSPDNANAILFDSGLMTTTLRGSIIVTFLVYITFYFYLKKNIMNKQTALFLSVCYLIFEIGFNNIYYFRTIMLLPFVIILLNYLEIEKKKRSTI